MSLYESTRAREDASPFSEVCIELDQDGDRSVRYAGQVIRLNPEWMRPRYPDMFNGDEIQLDSAGVYCYRPSSDRLLQKAAGGFVAYERITP